jgi:DNA polymerase III subunit delta
MADVPNKPVYVLHGSDAFLQDQHRAEITAAVLGQADPQTCLSRHDGDANLAAVLDDLRTLPFLGDRRLVIVDDADPFVSAHLKPLEDYLEAPAASGTLMLIVKTWRSNTRLAKLVAKVGLAFNCSPPEAGAMGGFLRKQAAALDRQLEPAAADLLTQWLGSDLARAAGELEKLALYTQGRKTVTAEDVGAVVAAGAGAAPFALTDALTEASPRAALEALEAMLTQRGEEYRVLGLLGWHLRRVLKAQHLLAGGRREAEVFQAARVFGRGQQGFRRLLAARTIDRTCRDFRQLIRADLAMKTGADAKASLQRLVVALC